MRCSVELRQTTPMNIHAHGTGSPHQHGLTLLELMVTLSIATILLTTAAPALQQFNRNQHLKSAVNSLHHDLAAARSEAIHRGSHVIVCPANSELFCREGNDWSDGWVIFEDDNTDGQRQEDEAVIRHGQALEQVAIINAPGRGELRFYPDGSAPGSNTSISLCNLDGPTTARKLVISNIGRIRRDTWPDLDKDRCPG